MSVDFRALSYCRAALVGIAVTAAQAFGQSAPVPQQSGSVKIDSGVVRNTSGQRAVVWSDIVQVKGAHWLRLKFAQAELGRTPPGGQPTQLRLTSQFDGAMQLMNAEQIKQWQNASAYFNGSTVLVELIADSDAPPSHVVIDEVLSDGDPQGDGGIASICGNDDRVLSFDPRAARVMSIGCTAWLIDDANHCFLTAGHCAGSGLAVVEFNVPLSAGGVIQHPGPQDQYAPDPDSVQFLAGGIGNDWCYFGCFPNSTTGLTAFEAQQAFYVLADTAPPVNGQSIRITGYGVDSSPPEYTQVQQTSNGPYTSLNGTTLQYQVDTTGGNSGSAVFDESTNLAIGIHTNAGCSGSGGANSGTAIQVQGLQTALANPQGVCTPAPKLAFNFPDGLPAYVNPTGDSIRVEVSGQNGGVPQPGTGKFYYGTGSGYTTVDMNQVSPNVYDAIIPAFACTTSLKYFFSARTSANEEVVNPQLAPINFYSTIAAYGLALQLFDDLEGSTSGWQVINDPSLTTGAWEVADPIGTVNGSALAAPEDDHTPGTGTRAFITQNGVPGGAVGAADVDGGPTHLISPTIDISSGDAIISYWQWLYVSAADDSLIVSVSNNDGATWSTVKATASSTVSGGNTVWQQASFRVGQFVPPTAQVRVRFSASDVPNNSIVEAGIDDFRVDRIVCQPPCPSDIDGSGTVNTADLLAVINNWGAPATNPADVNGDGFVNTADLLAVINAWGPCL